MASKALIPGLVIHAHNCKIGIVYYACILATTIANMLVLRTGPVSTVTFPSRAISHF